MPSDTSFIPQDHHKVDPIQDGLPDEISDKARTPVALFTEEPTGISQPAVGVILVDFGRVAFGNIVLTAREDIAEVGIHFGEDFVNGRINRLPPGTVRYASTKVSLARRAECVVAPAADARNTCTQAVHLPAAWGVILPFRWVEIEGWPADVPWPEIRRRSAFAQNWDDNESSFVSSDELLNRIWGLCRYSIKATTFAGIYVDGDRERIPYEADAYLNQISHYAVVSDFQMARDTFDYLMRHPTWPTEWAPHMIFMAHAEWMHTGDTDWLGVRYESLKTRLLLERAGDDGLIFGAPEEIKKDIVDWPPCERDNYVFTSVNTVVNSFHLRALSLMADLARALGRNEDGVAFDARFASSLAHFQTTLFDTKSGLYRDGNATDHVSLHGNLFPLAFGLVPVEQRTKIISYLRDKGMACSVYPAQYLLEALFENGAEDDALGLITATGDRSWKHMLESGATITWEAWDLRYKPNQDWNHAWGAAPANLLPRFVVGVQPLTAGWGHVLIKPHPGSLTSCSGKIPTPRGPVHVEWECTNGFRLTFDLPAGVTARLELPDMVNGSVWIDERQVEARRTGNRLLVANEWSGRHRVAIHLPGHLPQVLSGE